MLAWLSWIWNLYLFYHGFQFILYLYYVGFQVGVIGNLVHSSPSIKKEVLSAGALQPVIGLLRWYWWWNIAKLVVWSHLIFFGNFILLLSNTIYSFAFFKVFFFGYQFLLLREPKRSSFVTWTICSYRFRLQGRLRQTIFPFIFTSYFIMWTWKNSPALLSSIILPRREKRRNVCNF